MWEYRKYNNKRVEDASGRTFGSKLERAVFDLLCLREKAGEIKDIQQQDTVYLTKARIQYIPDFKFINTKTNEPEWAEAKGLETPVWRLKRKLWPHYGPGKLEVYKGRENNVVLHETLTRKFKGDDDDV